MVKNVIDLFKLKKIYNIIDKFNLDPNMLENMDTKDVIDYLMIYSIKLDDIDIFIKLKKMGGDPNRKFVKDYGKYNLNAINDNFIKPIHYVLVVNKHNSIYFLDYLIDDCKISPNELDGMGRTPINFATLKGNIENIKYLLECKNIDLNLNTHINKPLINILNNNDFNDQKKIKIIKMFIKYNIDIDMKDEYNITPFMVTCSVCNDFLLFKYMVNQKANPYNIDKFGNNILHYACKNNNNVNSKIVKYILDNFKKVNIDQLNYNLETPLSLAYANLGGEHEVIELLHKAGADFKNIFKTALENNPQIIKLSDLKKYRQYGADLNIKDRYNNNILLKILNKDINKFMKDEDILNIAQYLINQGVDITIKNSEGKSAIDYIYILNKDNQIFSSLVDMIEYKK